MQARSYEAHEQGRCAEPFRGRDYWDVDYLSTRSCRKKGQQHLDPPGLLAATRQVIFSQWPLGLACMTISEGVETAACPRDVARATHHRKSQRARSTDQPILRLTEGEHVHVGHLDEDHAAILERPAADVPLLFGDICGARSHSLGGLRRRPRAEDAGSRHYKSEGVHCNQSFARTTREGDPGKPFAHEEIVVPILRCRSGVGCGVIQGYDPAERQINATALTTLQLWFR